MSDQFDADHGIVYGPSGKLLDVYRAADPSGPAPTVLLWHGTGPDERDVMAPLARTAAALGVTVIVPDWRSDASDGGWAHLTESIVFARQHAGSFGGDAERIVLAGWSLGGLAAAGAVLQPALVAGWQPLAVVGIAGRYTRDKPEMGLRSPVVEVVAGVPFSVAIQLVHGANDFVVEPQESRDFHAALVQRGRRVSLTETETDHAGVVMTEYSPEKDRCLPASGESALRAGATTAAVLTRAAGLPESLPPTT